jgi:hypothetical protein
MACVIWQSVICRPSVVFRRIMMHFHRPAALFPVDLLVTDVGSNTTMLHRFTQYNEQGYQVALPVGRTYWLQPVLGFRLDYTKCVPC